MTSDPAKLESLSKLQRICFVVGAIGLALCGLGGILDLSQMLRSYLFGFVVCWTITLGCLGITLITHLVRSNWGQASRPFLAAGFATLPLLAAMFIPVALGLGKIYVWAGAEIHGSHHEADDEDNSTENKSEKPDEDAHGVSEQKRAYLNPEFFWMRAAGYFVVWLGLGLALSRPNIVHRGRVNGSETSWLRYVSGIGLGVTILTVTFATIDWVMSLEPEWYSTIFGGIFCAAGVVAALAGVILTAGYFGVEFTGVEKSTRSIIGDLGSLLLGFVLIWSYFAFSQYLIIWSGDLPSEITWYLERTQNGWEWIALLVVGFHFVLPFILLLSRENRRNVRTMTWITVMLLVVHVIDIFWNIKPAYSKSITLHWMDLAALAGLGGIWLACGAWNLKRQFATAPG